MVWVLRSRWSRLGYQVHKIEAPGTLEGGDVLAVGDHVYVGQGGRSNAEGIAQLRTILAPTGAKVMAVPMGPPSTSSRRSPPSPTDRSSGTRRR